MHCVPGARSGLILLIGCIASACPADDGGGDTSAGDGTTTSVSTSGVPGSTGTDGSADTTGSDGSSDGVDTTGTAGQQISGVVTDFVSGDPVEGAQVCLHELPAVACAIADASGAYTVTGVPAGVDTALVVSAEGFVPLAMWGNTGVTDLEADLALAQTTLLTAFAGILGLELDDATGSVSVAFFSGGEMSAMGVEMSMTPVSGTGPVYLDKALVPTLDQPGTGLDGAGGWFLVEPGEVEVSGTLDGVACTPGDVATLGSAPDTARMLILPGHFNSVASGFQCGGGG